MLNIETFYLFFIHILIDVMVKTENTASHGQLMEPCGDTKLLHNLHAKRAYEKSWPREAS